MNPNSQKATIPSYQDIAQATFGTLWPEATPQDWALVVHKLREALQAKSNGPADPDYAVPSIEDLRELVKLPADNQTHIENLEKAYGEARRIIMKLLPSRSASEAGADDARDAARYRWLRQGDRDGPRTRQMQYHHMEHLDKAIDAAIASDATEGGTK